MQAGEKEVLEALRVHAERGKLPGEWANVDPQQARRHLTVSEMRDETFRSILGTLKIRELYRPIDDDHGAVKI